MRVPNDIKLAQAVPEIDAVLGGHDHHVQVRCEQSAFFACTCTLLQQRLHSAWLASVAAHTCYNSA
jgi:hypothetical protein